MTCPERPRALAGLPFRRRRMVRWLSPGGLISTGVQAALSGLFGQYADRREVQAALADPQVVDLSDRDDLWLDYVADTGDGFDPTYAVARLLAADPLAVAGDGEAHATRAGGALVLGGDLVYPTPGETAYHDRLLGPLTAARPCPAPDEAPRTLLALPGNHDWYDGLTTFLRLFGQPRRVGGWATRQTRSYFAVRLPHRWWLLGIDIQLDFHIDEPQLAYFERVAQHMAAGDRVVLCTAKPSWVREGLRGDRVYDDPRTRRNLEHVERRVLAPRGISPRLTLAGHLHHYARYETDGADGPARHRITAGGGGAFLSPTHTLPPQVRWPRFDAAGGRVDERYELRATHPGAAVSRRLRWAAVRAPFANPSLLAVLGAVYLALVWTLQSGLGGASAADALAGASAAELVAGLVRNPGGLLLAAAVVAALVAFADAGSRAGRLALGAAHGAAHLAAATAGAGLVGALAGELGLLGFAGVLVGVVGVGGGLVAGGLFGLYLLLAHVALGRHANEAFSAQHIPHHKSFVRLHLDAGGALTLYPIGVDEVPRRWAAQPDAPAHAPWLEPADRELAPRLVEAPVVIRPGSGEARPT